MAMLGSECQEKSLQSLKYYFSWVFADSGIGIAMLETQAHPSLKANMLSTI